jgi:hypothetical protein
MPSLEPTVPLTATGADETGQSGLPNWTIRLPALVRFMCEHILATPLKGGNSGHNGSNLDKGNILEPTFDTLIEEGRNAFEAYHANHEEIFLSHYKVT